MNTSFAKSKILIEYMRPCVFDSITTRVDNSDEILYLIHDSKFSHSKT